LNELVTSELTQRRAALVPCGEEPAKKFAVMLVGGFADMKVQDPKAFIWHLRQLMAQYPEDICERAVVEIPRKTPKYKFGIDTVTEFLETETKHRRDMLRLAEREAEELRRDAEETAREREIREGREAYRAGKMRSLKELMEGYKNESP